MTREEVPGGGIFTEEVDMPQKRGGLWYVLTEHQRDLLPSTETPNLLRTDLSYVDLAGEGSNTLLVAPSMLAENRGLYDLQTGVTLLPPPLLPHAVFPTYKTAS